MGLGLQYFFIVASIITFVFVIKKDIKDVLSGVAATWFGEPGGGTQYKLPLGTRQLLKEGYLEVMKQ